MILIDDKGMKYRAVKKNGEYYLLTEHARIVEATKYNKVEVKGKKNIFTYINNNKLRKYEEVEHEKDV